MVNHKKLGKADVLNVADNYINAMSHLEDLKTERKELTKKVNEMKKAIEGMEKLLIEYISREKDDIPLEDGQRLSVDTKTIKRAKKKEEKQKQLETAINEVYKKKLSPERCMLKIGNIMASDEVEKKVLTLHSGKTVFKNIDKERKKYAKELIKNAKKKKHKKSSELEITDDEEEKYSLSSSSSSSSSFE